MNKKGLFILASVVAAVALVFAACTSTGKSASEWPKTVRGEAYGHNAGPVVVEVTVQEDGTIVSVNYIKNEADWPAVYFTAGATSESPGFVLRLLQSDWPSANTQESLENPDRNDGIEFGPVMVAKQSFYLVKGDKPDNATPLPAGADVIAGATASLWAIMSAGQEAYNTICPTVGARPVQATKIIGDQRVIVGVLADENGVITDGYARINGWSGEGTRPSLNGAMAQLLASGTVNEADYQQFVVENTTQDHVNAFIEAAREAIAKAAN